MWFLYISLVHSYFKRRLCTKRAGAMVKPLPTTVGNVGNLGKVNIARAAF
jgi:hypothetical protein